MAERYRMATIVRFSSREAFTVFPPPMATDNEWHELAGSIVTRTAEDARIMDELDNPQQD